MRQPGDRERDRPVVAVLRQPIDDGPRIAKAEQLRDLVVGLTRRIVPRPAEQLIGAGPFDEIQAGVAARDDQHDGRQRQLAVLQHERFDVAGEVVHGHERQVRRRGGRLGERHADEERPDQARPLRDGDRTEVAPGRSRFDQRAIDHAADVAKVLPRGELRHDPAPLGMDRDLGRDHVRAHHPGRCRVAGLFDHGGRGLVAGGFDP